MVWVWFKPSLDQFQTKLPQHYSQLCLPGSSSSLAPSPPIPTPSSRLPTSNPTEDWPPTSTTIATLGRSSESSTGRRTALLPPSKPSSRNRGMSVTTWNVPKPPLASTTSAPLSTNTPTPPSSSAPVMTTTTGTACSLFPTASASMAKVSLHSDRRVMLPPAATLAMLEVRGERKYEGNRPKVSYCFCQELNPDLCHNGGPCDCMSRPSPFL
jgi:hypothetical protein